MRSRSSPVPGARRRGVNRRDADDLTNGLNLPQLSDLHESDRDSFTDTRISGSPRCRSSMAGMWVRAWLSVAALLSAGCSAARPIPPAAERPVALPVAIDAAAASSMAGTSAAVATKTPDYVPEPSATVDPLKWPTLVWPPLGISADSGSKACRGWHVPLGRVCSVVGDPRQALLALAERAQLPEDLFGLRRTPPRLRDLEALSAELFRLEGCELPVGVVRLLRAQWLPECAEDLASSALESSNVHLDPAVRLSLYGEALGAACARIPQSMPVYHGKFEKARFATFVEKSVRPWQARTLRSLQACGDAVKSLPYGTYAREAALRGYAQAWRRFAAHHRSSPIDDAIKRDYEARTQYYGGLDEESRVAWAGLAEVIPSYSVEFALQGNYGFAREVSSFSSSFEAESPLSRLGLPMVPTPLGSTEQRIGHYIAHPTSMLLLAKTDLQQPAVLSAMIRQGLPQSVRSFIGQSLTGMPVTDPARRAIHALLAHVLVRVGLVTRQRYAFERAATELAFAEATPENKLLLAIARVLSGLDTDALMKAPERRFPEWSALNVSPLASPGLSANADPELRVLAALNRDYLSLIGMANQDGALTKHYASMSEHAHRSLLREPERRCLWEYLSLCVTGLALKDDPRFDDPRCRCTPWPWRVTD
jgi:hypothetical protein